MHATAECTLTFQPLCSLLHPVMLHPNDITLVCGLGFCGIRAQFSRNDVRCRRPPCQARRMAPSKSFTAHASTIWTKNSFTDHTKCKSSNKSAVNITALARSDSLTLSPAACPASLEHMNPDAIALSVCKRFDRIKNPRLHSSPADSHTHGRITSRSVRIAAQRSAIRITRHIWDKCAQGNLPVCVTLRMVFCTFCDFSTVWTFVTFYDDECGMGPWQKSHSYRCRYSFSPSS